MTHENKMKVLTDKNLDERRNLHRELTISTALLVEFPDLFDHGTVKTKIRSIGDQAAYPDEFRVTITKGNDEGIEVQLTDTNLSDDILKLMMPKNVTWRKPKAV